MYEFDSIFDVNDRINYCADKISKGKLRRSSLNLSNQLLPILLTMVEIMADKMIFRWITD